MDNENSQAIGYPFLEEEKAKKHFADLNTKLLNGRHIQTEEFELHSFVSDCYEELSNFYLNLYQLKLVREVFDSQVYFYLDFFDGTHGKLSDPSRYKVLSEWQTVVGLLLLDLYYTHYFEEPKEISWGKIKQEIEAGDKKEMLQQLFFGDVREGFTTAEWGEVEKKWKNAIVSFDELGWVNRKSKQGSELKFEIKPAIHRLATLYAKELEQIDHFVTLFKADNSR